MANMGSKMTAEDIEDLIKVVDTRGDGYIYLDEMAECLCPPKDWLIEEMGSRFLRESCRI